MTWHVSISVLLTQAQRRVVSVLLPRLADRLKLDEKNPRTISFTAKELETIRQKAEAARPNADNGRKRNSLRHIIDAANKAIDDSQGVGAIPRSERLYQFKVTLNESQPPIWRRIQVRNCTLDRLHELIQTAMGWTNSHLHQFEINGDRYGDPELLKCGEPDHDYVHSTVTKISEIVPQDGKRFQFVYEYDFGDCWQHEVLFEGCLQAEKGSRYPLCLEGERSCPPEDVGRSVSIRVYPWLQKPENENELARANRVGPECLSRQAVHQRDSGDGFGGHRQSRSGREP